MKQGNTNLHASSSIESRSDTHCYLCVQCTTKKSSLHAQTAETCKCPVMVCDI